MKQLIYTTREVDVKYLKVDLFKFYLEDGTINGEDGNEQNTPFYCKKYAHWYGEERPCISFTIDIDEGKIIDYPIGTVWDLSYKVVDEGIYTIFDKDNEVVSVLDDYVPDLFSIDDDGYGDYICMHTDENGYIENWNPHFEEFPNFKSPEEDY